MNVVMLRSICHGVPYLCGYFPNKCDFFLGGGGLYFHPELCAAKGFCGVVGVLLVLFWGFFVCVFFFFPER